MKTVDCSGSIFVMKLASVGHNDKMYLMPHRGYFVPAPGLCQSSTLFEHFFEATGLIEAKLHMEPPWVGGN